MVVEPAHEVEEDGGYANTCSSTAGQSASQWDAGQFATFTYDTFVVTLSSTTLLCNKDPITITVNQPPSTSINSGSIINAEDNFTVVNGTITSYPTFLFSHVSSFEFQVTPSDDFSTITVTLDAGVLYGAVQDVRNPETTLPIEGERADSDGDGTLDCADDCPDDPNKVVEGVCGCGVPDELCAG